ncbi:MAG: ATP-binding protein [Deltaproteobacteria bacterium]|nr:ATP-binding protein [Deltaproteobacteria bacterium]
MPSRRTRTTTTPAPKTATAKDNAELVDQLCALKLTRTAADLDDFIARATKRRWSPRVILEELVRQELEERERRSLERRKKDAKLGRFKPIDKFDWSWPTKIDRSIIDRALSGALVAERENLVLIASQGLGKTMLGCNIAHAAVIEGYSALFVEASTMLLDLGAQDSARALERRFRHYARPDLLCIDENKSVVITTNLAFTDWPTIFPGASCVTALIDRLTHHADICLIEGESYRTREAEERAKARRSARNPSQKK